MKLILGFSSLILLFFTVSAGAGPVDTGQTRCYNNSASIVCPSTGSQFFGQDAQYQSTQPSYRDNGDATVTDNNTGLMWQSDPGSKVDWNGAQSRLATFSLGGYNNWRLPTIKELYTLINFNGSNGPGGYAPYIDTNYFNFSYGDESAGERLIDSQWMSSTRYVSTTMNGNDTVFGVNFADGRIKGYGTNKEFFVIFVRGGSFGANNFTDNNDGTVTDWATGAMWLQGDDGVGRNWEQALEYCENMTDSGYDDWRLPNAKELQGIVDYTRSPATTGEAAIDPVFYSTPITDEGGQENFGFYWTSTTHLDGANPGSNAIYVAFGEALGFMQQAGAQTFLTGPPQGGGTGGGPGGTATSSGGYTLMDVHGAGAQRSDPKTGDPANYPNGFGPQGDVIRIYNLVRCVR